MDVSCDNCEVFFENPGKNGLRGRGERPPGLDEEVSGVEAGGAEPPVSLVREQRHLGVGPATLL